VKGEAVSKLYEITHTLNAAWQLIEESADEDGSFDSRLKSVFDAVQEEFEDFVAGVALTGPLAGTYGEPELAVVRPLGTDQSL
jgi:hypothetical protein